MDICRSDRKFYNRVISLEKALFSLILLNTKFEIGKEKYSIFGLLNIKLD